MTRNEASLIQKIEELERLCKLSAAELRDRNPAVGTWQRHLLQQLEDAVGVQLPIYSAISGSPTHHA